MCPYLKTKTGWKAQFKLEKMKPENPENPIRIVCACRPAFEQQTTNQTPWQLGFLDALQKLFFVKLGWGWRGRYCVCHKTKHIFRGGLLHLRIRLAAPRACTGSENKSFNLSLELSTAYHSCQEVKTIPLLTFTVQITWHWFKLRGYKWSYCSFRTAENTCMQVEMEIPRFGHF